MNLKELLCGDKRWIVFNGVLVASMNYRVLFNRFLYERGHVAAGEPELQGAESGGAEACRPESLPRVQATSGSAVPPYHSEGRPTYRRYQRQCLHFLTVMAYRWPRWGGGGHEWTNQRV
jgi:hypothetical protein